jgi:hypothetical protein
MEGLDMQNLTSRDLESLDPTQLSHGMRPPTTQKIRLSINPATELDPSTPYPKDMVIDQSDQ